MGKKFKGDVDVVIRWDVSFNDLAKMRKKEGIEIPRTGHLGGIYQQSLLPILLGAVKPVLFTNTIPERDTRFHPAFIIKNGKAVRVSPEDQDGILTPYVDFLDKNGHRGKCPAHNHYITMKELFPETISSADWFDQPALIHTLVYAAYQAKMDVFNRYVDSSGKVYYLEKTEDDILFFEGGKTLTKQEADQLFYEFNKKMIYRVAFGDEKPGEGVLLSAWAIMCFDLVREAVVGRNEAWHSGGLDMSVYATQKPFLKALDQFWKEARKVINGAPEKMRYNLIPVIFPFVVPIEHKDALDQIYFWYKKSSDAKEIRSKAYRKATEEKGKGAEPENAAELHEAFNNANAKFRKAKETFTCWNNNPDERNYFSHYDLYEGHEYYIPEWAGSESLGTLRNLMI